MKLHPLACAVALAGALPASLDAQATFTAIPGATAFTDITPDGATVLAHDFLTNSAALWTEAGGLQPIGSAVSAEGLSVDASAVAGSRIVGGKEVASRWSAATGWVDLGGLTPGELGCDAFLSSGFDISGDGATLVGLGWEACAGRAFRWTSASGMLELPQLGTKSARANAISNDGLTIGGWDEHITGPRQPAAWFPDGSEMIFGGPDSVGEVQALSDDGSVIAGELNGTAFYWTAAGGTVDLGLLPGGFGFETASVFAMSGDGQTLAGSSGSFGPFGLVNAFVWTPEHGMQNLRDRLNAEGAAVPDSFVPSNVLGVSDDGLTLVGWGTDFDAGPFGAQRAFIATLAPQSWFDLGQGLAGTTGEPVLTGSGVQVATLEETVALTNGAPNAAMYLVVGFDRVDLPTKGGVLVPSPDVVALMPLDASGELSIRFRWPAGVPAATSLYWQAWVADGGAPSGFAASNALECITP